MDVDVLRNLELCVLGEDESVDATTQQLAATLYERLHAEHGYTKFVAFLQSLSVEPPMVYEHQFVEVFSKCCNWPDFKLLDLFDCLDINEAGEVTDRLCHMIVCLWLAKECGRCVHFWGAFKEPLMRVLMRYLGPGPDESEPTVPTVDLKAPSITGKAHKAIELLSITGGWSSTDFPSDCIDKWDGNQVPVLYLNLFEAWDLDLQRGHLRFPHLQSSAMSLTPDSPVSAHGTAAVVDPRQLPDASGLVNTASKSKCCVIL
jgi:hypothetical protein|uniref:Uncharacterized protein n=1 Tax=Eutreptiella gymnastica TaxID=73025 RepID=A0A7S4FE26_9EUGL|mmetsp:Transcript_95606/g.160585  ORF Transcript_95606/g.160585 Transcript_95606/m.160585 type:complete len:260 (+) Transcript_95606:64-843(+)